MRRWGWVLLGAAVGLTACRREASEDPPPGPATQAAEAAERADREEAQGPYTVTKPKLDAYVGYQRAMLQVQADLVRGLEGLAGAVADGGPGAQGAREATGEVAVQRSMRLIEAKARAEAKAREAAGLSEADVNALGRIVTDVISQRHLAQVMRYDEEIRATEALKAKLPAAQQQELEPRLRTLREQEAGFRGLAEARRRYGDANVDLVLTREAELAKNYREMLEAYGGSQR
jgi:hypothetical protein